MRNLDKLYNSIKERNAKEYIMTERKIDNAFMDFRRHCHKNITSDAVYNMIISLQRLYGDLKALEDKESVLSSIEMIMDYEDDES